MSRKRRSTSKFVEEFTRETPLEKLRGLSKQQALRNKVKGLLKFSSEELIVDHTVNLIQKSFINSLYKGKILLINQEALACLLTYLSHKITTCEVLGTPLLNDYINSWIEEIFYKVWDAMLESFNISDFSKTFERLSLHMWKTLTSLYFFAEEHTYVYSSDLAEMLKHTSLNNLPLERLRLPHTGIEFCIPEDILIWKSSEEDFPILSFYVEESEENNKRKWHVSLMLGEFKELPRLISSYSLTFDEGETVEDAVKGAVKYIAENQSDIDPAYGENIVNSTLFIAASVVYATMPDADTILGGNSEEYRLWVKSLAKQKLTKRQKKEAALMDKRMKNPNRVYLGRNVRILNRHRLSQGDSLPDGRKRKSPKVHWRQGHFHSYWVKKAEDSKEKKIVVKWIQPVIVGFKGSKPKEGSRALLR